MKSMIALGLVFIAMASAKAEQFKTGSSTPTPVLLQNIDDLVRSIKNQEVQKILVEGHTDVRGGDLYNLKLSQDRADAVKQVLVSKRIKPSIITAVGMGKTQLLPNSNNAQNRRVVVHVFSEKQSSVFIYSDCTDMCQELKEEGRANNILSAYVVRSQKGFSSNIDGNTITVENEFRQGVGIMYQRRIFDSLWLGGAFDNNSGKSISLGLEF